jgi:hypothetical protein
VVAGGAVALALIARGGPGPPIRLDAALKRDTLVVAESGRLRIFRLDRSRELDLATSATTGLSARPVSVGDAVVFVDGGQAKAISSPSFGPPSTIGAADRLIAGVNPGQVWLVRDQSPGPQTVQLGCVHGAAVFCTPQLTAALTVPAGTIPLAPVLNNLLLEHTGAGVTAPPVVWDPLANRVVYAFSEPLDVVATHYSQVAWRGGRQGACTVDAECPLHLTDVQTGTDELIPPPPGANGYLGGGAFSPDGTYLAAFVASPGPPLRARPVLIRLADKHTEPQTTTVAIGEPVGAAAWDGSGTVVFVSGIDGAILACRPATATPIVLPAPASYTFTAL